MVWWLSNMKSKLQLVETDVLFGYHHAFPKLKALNFTILYAKAFIVKVMYSSNTNTPYLYAFLVYLKRILEFEKYICRQNNEYEYFENHFLELYEALS